jgi:hypothetical protein
MIVSGVRSCGRMSGCHAIFPLSLADEVFRVQSLVWFGRRIFGGACNVFVYGVGAG